MAEREPVAVEDHDTVLLGDLQLGDPEVALAQRVDDPHEVAVGLGGGDEQGAEDGGRQSLEEHVDDALSR